MKINLIKTQINKLCLYRTDKNNELIAYRRSSKRNVERVNGQVDEEFKIIQTEKVESGNVILKKKK